MTTVSSFGSAKPEPRRRPRRRGSSAMWVVLAILVTFGIGVAAGRWVHNGARLIVQCQPSPAHTVTVHPHTSPTFSCNP